MHITFDGAAGGIVTGSCHLMSINGSNYLVDCGMFQGHAYVEGYNWQHFEFDPGSIRYLFLTHAHLDHVGRLPLLVKAGFRGKIIATDATRDLTRLVLLDAAKLHKEAVEHGRVKVNGKKIKYPLFTEDDVDEVIALFDIHEYGTIYELDDNIIKFRLRDAGHILGSTIFEFWVQDKEKGDEKKLVFSGDLGQRGARIIRDPDYIRTADYVVIETTYGGRLHKDKASTVLEFLEILTDVSKHQSVAMIPVFALERSQEILYELNLLFERRILTGLKVYLDSPMAIRATRIFERYRKYYDEDALALMREDDEIFRFQGLEFTETVDQSKRIKNAKSAIVMAGSGMMTGGRILHHVQNFGGDPNNHIIFVGYQVKGTLGRMLIDGKRRVKIYGKPIEVRSKIHTLGGFSAHADQMDLLYWLRGFGHSVKKVFLVHGEDDQREMFASKVIAELGLAVHMPKLKESVEV